MNISLIRNRFFPLFSSLLCVGLLASCSDDNGDDIKFVPQISDELKAEMTALAGEWEMTEVRQNGEAPQFEIDMGATLKIYADTVTGEDNFYAVVNGNYILPSSAARNWMFIEGSNYSMVNFQTFTLEVSSVSENELVLTREVDSEIAVDRVSAVGSYDIHFTKLTR